MNNEPRLGRLVQCKCAHTCLPDSPHGFQWLLPRTKSKHMLYQQVSQKNKHESATCLDQLQEKLASFSLKVNKGGIKKKRKTFKMPILMETELKKKIAFGEKNTVLKEFFVKTSYN
ncbi:hypothetical protein INT47_011882 [Mucor saturninus]|uniref:Uncharacterized protein n=1 Tax=Mucor saturninus TaxID=64648 RepID=A0A8H7RCI2_9FUNG|nr:hypothetical protein INT47_011882 [Mucor saturninus]